MTLEGYEEACMQHHEIFDYMAPGASEGPAGCALTL